MRAGLPAGRKVGDKTDGGGFGTRDGVGPDSPPDEPPIALAMTMTAPGAPIEDRNAGMADIARNLMRVPGGRGDGS